MPRISKKLPRERTDYSFGDLVYWHLFVYGTRPRGSPAAKAGRAWEPGAICGLIGVTERTLRNWIADKHLPDSVIPLERELFGDNPAWDEARLELAEALRNSRARKARKPFSRLWPFVRSNVLLLPPPGDAPDGEASSTRDVSPESSGKDRKTEKNQSLVCLGGKPNGSRLEPGNLPDRPRPMRENPGRAGAGVPDEHLLPGRSDGASRHHQFRTLGPLAVTAVMIGLGMYIWSIPSVPGPAPSQAPSRKGASPSPAGPPPGTGRQGTDQKPVQDGAERRAGADKPSPGTEEDVAHRVVAAQRKAEDRERQAREQEAERRDREELAASRAIMEREQYARLLARMGYRLRDDARMNGTNIRVLETATFLDCALACVEDKCDAFAWTKWYWKGRADQLHRCSTFKAPLVFANDRSYLAGERVLDLAPGQAPSPAEIAKLTAFAVPPPPKPVTWCPGGPVKVTGFDLTCEATLTGGSVPGLPQSSYEVTTINACAAKCRPLAECVGFAFNAAGPDGRSACQLFGRTRERRDATGWIAGER
ncbi:hypothetical protein A33M_3993 [Rhodovulum sp. PH10]|nr:hypothetical protein A33M_3993 [Rhodovulum sp. PH10]